MVTTDGQEAVIGRYYYNELGEQVVLDDCVTDSQGKTKYLVTPVYEGKAMEIYCVGGPTLERDIPYEHHGSQRLVNAIFVEEPMAKVGEKTKKAVEELHYLALAVGELANRKKALEIETSKNEKLAENLKKQIEAINIARISAAKENDKLILEIAEKKAKLSELEDLCNRHPGGDYLVVEKAELARLKKRDYELDCLIRHGVDTWDGYGDAMKKYLERYPE